MLAVKRPVRSSPNLPIMERGALDRPGISRRLREERDRAGMTREQVADVLQIHVNTLEGWENPRLHVVPFDRIENLADLYGVTVGWLMHGSDYRDELEEVRNELRTLRALLENTFGGKASGE